MRQAISTKFLGPTNTRGARVVAKADAGSQTTSWDYAESVCRNHAKAAQALAEKLGWAGYWTGGSLPGSGYCFVVLDRDGADFKVEAL